LYQLNASGPSNASHWLIKVSDDPTIMAIKSEHLETPSVVDSFQIFPSTLRCYPLPLTADAC
jgi:hypothetical protein